ncbi:conserved oligomeric Golgi complex subunit 4 [Monosporozyma servazzii]
MDLDSISDDQLSKNLAKYSLLLTKLSTLSQVNKLSNIIKSDHNDKNKSLKTYINDTHLSQNKQIRKLELNRTDLTSSLTEFHNILSLISKSNYSAELIHEDIYNNDMEHKFLNSTLSFLTSIRSLKNNITLIESAIKESNYIIAARGIHELNQLPRHILESNFAQAIIPTPELPYSVIELIEIWTNQLRDLFKTNFTNAMIQNDIPTLTKFFQLFPLINEPTLGLSLYSKYVTDMISQENQKFTIGSMKLDSRFDLILLQLFKIASTIINEHSKIIAKAYGHHYRTYVMEKIELEVELQCCLVWNYFKEEKLLKVNGNLDMNQNNTSLNNLKTLIMEFSSFLQNWSMYCRFFSVRWEEFTSSINDPSISNTNKNNKKTEESNEEVKTLSKAPPIINGSFIRKLQEEKCINMFQELNYSYLSTSFQNSIKLEELPSLNELISLEPIRHDDPSSWPISSVLEDITLLLRQTLVNTVNTGQYVILEELLLQLPRFIQNEFLIKFLQNKFKVLQTKLNTGSLVPLKRYIPNELLPDDNQEKISSPRNSLSKLSNLQNNINSNNNNNNNNNNNKFNIRGAFANIQSNLQSVVAAEEDNMDAILGLHHYLIYVNTLYLVVMVLHKLLINEIIDDNPKLLIDNFPFHDESQNIKDLLINCETKIITQVKKLQAWSVKYLFQTICLPRLRTLLDDLLNNRAENNYICGIDDFENMSLINTFVQKWNQFMIPFQNILYQDAYSELLGLVVTFIKQAIEKNLWTWKVNELGAVKLDRELSLFISTVCGTHYSIRDKFTRLTQIVLILGFDDDDFDVTTGDVKEELTSSIDWVLNPQERIRARNLKVDKRR